MFPKPRRVRSLPLGTMFGAPVSVRPSMFLAIAVLAYYFSTYFSAVGGASLLIGIMLAVQLFVSMLVHEVGHAAAAHASGRKIHRMEVMAFGGITEFEDRNMTPRGLGFIALVGPVVSAAIGFGLLALSQLDLFSEWPAAAVAVAGRMNIVIAVFNILPGFPMDGGRILEALVWRFTGRRHTGLAAAAWGGRVFALGWVAWVVGTPVLDGTAPNLVSVVWAMVLFSFLWPAASSALTRARMMGRRVGVGALTLMRPAVPVPYDVTVADALATADSYGAREVVVLARDGAPAGRFEVEVARRVPEERRAHTRLDAVTMPLPRGSVVSADDDAETLVGHLREWWGKTDAWVVVREGEPVGVLRLLDAMNALR